jgi:hypothetical protein
MASSFLDHKLCNLSRSCLGLPLELGASLSDWGVIIDLIWLEMLLADNVDATVLMGDGGITGMVVFASLQH